MQAMNITTSGTYRQASTWTPPTYGDPVMVSDGVLRQGGTVQLWPKSAPFCDHVLNNGVVLAGPYVKPVTALKERSWYIGEEPFVYRAVSEVPLVSDESNPTGVSVWPPPVFSLYRQKDLDVTLFIDGHCPSEAVNITECEGCRVRLYLSGSGAHFWKMKGLVTVERSPYCSVEVVCGESMSTTVVRSIGSPGLHAVCHSAVVSNVETLDSGHGYYTTRHKVDGVTKWSGGGGRFEWLGDTRQSPLTYKLRALRPTFEFADWMGDDWYPGCVVYAKSAYVSGPGNVVTAKRTTLDTRQGWKDWPDCPTRSVEGNWLQGDVSVK